ncbi:predicted protein [Naegleria gruberi]|uniref:Predicted protein n=1 Tax=Naegleria gruberi TaxID=5762 RepID=D2W3T6_NAEGR|nr:uncharacterized protein NAEGRDRAFT_76061 [Naegleria gruberi]EFC36229.1 predicted protein [Naegleria gruberi]|eukprot:XP_002668973.1 predicted protein [Naegleria gruberi strain NEG-M]
MSFQPRTIYYNANGTPSYSPSSPAYAPSFYLPKNTVLSFDLDEKVVARIEKETRNWGVLRWRSPNLGERYWGHVYMSVDSKIVEIIKDHYGKKGLITKVRELLEDSGEPNSIVEFNAFLLPTHFTVISCKEWQQAFFGLEKEVKYFTVKNPTDNVFQSPIEFVNTPYNSHSKLVKEEKIQELGNFTYFTRSDFAKSLPIELLSHIKEFLLMDLKECGQKFKFSITGQVSLVPRYFEEKVGFILHIDSPEMNELRMKYGFKSMEFSIPLGVTKFEWNNSPQNPTKVFIKNFSKKRTRDLFESNE